MSEATRVHLPRPRKRLLAAFLCPIVLLTTGIATAQENIDLDTAKRIRDTASNHSQIMEMAGYFTDVTGPRLTGSPNLKRAEEYARDKLRDWGLENAHLEAWGPFGRGWSLEKFHRECAFAPVQPTHRLPQSLESWHERRGPQ